MNWEEVIEEGETRIDIEREDREQTIMQDNYFGDNDVGVHL